MILIKYFVRNYLFINMAEYKNQYVIHLPKNFVPISFTKSNIYQYSKNNLHIIELTKIIENTIIVTNDIDNKKNLMRRQRNTLSLCICYDKLIKNKMNEIITDIINDCCVNANDHEMFAICLAAIINQDINIMHMLSLKDFDFGIYFRIFGADFRRGCYLIDYAIYQDKITVVKYLLELGAKLASDSAVARPRLEITNQYDTISFVLPCLKDELFDFIIDSYPQYHQLLFIASICASNNNRIDKLLTTLGTNIKVELPTNSIHDYYNIRQKIYHNLNVDMFKLMATYGLDVNHELLEIIFIRSNIDLVDYIMFEYHFVPTNRLIDDIFSDFDLPRIKLLIKHNIDLSNIEIINDHTDLIGSLGNCNIDSKIFLAYMLNHFYTDEV